MLFYSAATGAFYDRDLHADLPEDAREISAEYHAELLAGQSAGLMIGDDAGYPILFQRPEPSPEEALAAERAQMVVSRYQIRASLYSNGVLYAFDGAADDADANDDPMTAFGWREAPSFRRDSPTILAIAAHLGMPDEQVDDLFRHAAQVPPP